MDSLFELQAILLDQFHQQRFYHREQFDKINLDNSVTGILGMRGVGKTTFLLHTILKESTAGRRALYVSADHIYFLENKLLDLVGQLYKETDVRLLCIDEIHKYPNWQQELKNISDFYLDFKVMFSGSSMIDIIHSKFDLSRRVTLHRLNGFSFREYLAFNEIQEIPKCDLKTLLDQHASLTQEIETSQILQHFKRYLKIGYFPFAQQ